MPESTSDSGADASDDSSVLTDGSPDDSSCNDLVVTADPVKPYIIFIVDRSGSMKDLFPYDGDVDCGNLGGDPACLSRWQSTRDVLLGAANGPLAGEGVIEAIEDYAFVGMVQYTGLGDGANNATFDPGTTWPLLKETPAAASNLSNILGDFLPFAGTQANSTEPPNSGDTPTGESVLATLCHLRPPYDNTDPACNALDVIQDDINTTATVFALPAEHRVGAPANPLLPGVPGNAPVIFVLATDGEPDSSWAPDGLADQARIFSMQGVRAARVAASNDLGISIPTYVVSLALDSAHLRELACEGDTGAVPTMGRPAAAQRCMNNDAPATGGVILASDAEILRTQLNTVITNSIPCSFQLAGRVNDIEAALDEGQVTVNGVPVPADPVNGWGLSDDQTFVLNGTACADFRAMPGSSLSATFPCGGTVIIIE